VAADIEVPLPFKMPVMVVDSVIEGVVEALITLPENPFAFATDILVTVPPPPPPPELE
jgi:hypothetical protein